MYLTVRQLLNTSTMAGVKVLSGAAGLDNKFIFITPLDCPDIADWMVGYELLITQGYAIKDESPLRRRLIRDLAQKKVAALAIKEGRFLDDIPDYMLEDSEKYSIPILRLPYKMNWDVFVGPVDYWFFNPAQELIQLAMFGSGLDGICNKLQDIIQSPVCVMDADFDLMGCSTAFDPALLADLPQRQHRLERRYFIATYPRYTYHSEHLDALNMQADIFAMNQREEYYGYIALIREKDMPELSEYDIRTLELAALTMPLQIIKQHDDRSQRYESWNIFIQSLLDGRQENEAQLRSQGQELGLDLGAAYSVALLSLASPPAERPKTQRSAMGADLLEHCYELLERAAAEPGQEQWRSVLVCTHGEYLIFLLPEQPHETDRLAGELLELLTDSLRLSEPRLCLGQAQPLHQLQTSYQEALQTFNISTALKPGLQSYQQLGLLKLFINPEGRLDMAAVQEIYDMTIRPLLEHGEDGAMLLRTLACYLVSNMSIQATAEQLFVHKNTLRYRLAKIERLTGLSLSHVPDIINFSLGLLAHKMVVKLDK